MADTGRRPHWQQAELDALFRRRSRAQTWRLGWLLLGAMIVLLVVMKLLNSLTRP